MSKDFLFDEEEEDKVEDLIGFYDTKKGYRGEFPESSMNFLTTFSYCYMDIGKTDYHFHLPEFDGVDRLAYFKKLKECSNEYLEDLVNNVDHKDRFSLTHNIFDPEFTLVSELFGEKIEESNRPVLGHFRLYHVDLTEQDVLDIQSGKNVKNPRIFFLLDKNSLCYILFYDPFHKIHPMGKSTIDSLLNQFKT